MGDVLVLLVEDEVRLADAVARGLRSEGFEVEVVHDGIDGLHLATEREYAAIVLDIMLPGLNGFRVCAQLRDAGVWTPILMLTAKDGELDETEALDTGADDFLSKPFSFPVLVARLRALVRRGAPPRPTTLRFGHLVLDPATRACEQNGATVDLTTTEFTLLEQLMRADGAIVSKRRLFEATWGHERDIDLNLVEVHIGNLRRKLAAAAPPSGADPMVGPITTVRGAGYRLAPRSRPEAERPRSGEGAR